MIKAASTSLSLKQGSYPSQVRLQSKKLKREETRNREDGQKIIQKFKISLNNRKSFIYFSIILTVFHNLKDDTFEL